MAGEKELATGNFYSVELDVNAKDEYQNLQKKLDELGKDYKKEILDFFTESENELQELIDSGWFIAYELDHDYIPVRSAIIRNLLVQRLILILQHARK